MIRRIGGGPGEAIPIGSGVSGRPSSGDRDAAETIVKTARRVLEIAPGERRLLPEFGCRIHELEGFDRAQVRELGAGLVEEALERWVPALGVERAEVRHASGAKLRVALRVSSRWHEFDIKHRPALSGRSTVTSWTPPPPEQPERPPA